MFSSNVKEMIYLFRLKFDCQTMTVFAVWSPPCSLELPVPLPLPAPALAPALAPPPALGGALVGRADAGDAPNWVALETRCDRTGSHALSCRLPSSATISGTRGETIGTS